MFRRKNVKAAVTQAKRRKVITPVHDDFVEHIEGHVPEHVLALPEHPEMKCKNCEHPANEHYGATVAWCNRQDCKCLEFN